MFKCTLSRQLNAALSIGLMFSLPSAAFAAEMVRMELWQSDDQYHLRSASTINAPVELIYNTLLDYTNFYRLSGGIKETRYLDPDPDGTPVAFTLLESCVLFFCKQVKKTERVTIKPNNEIILEVDPARSDFKYMRSRWTVEKHGKHSLLTYDMDMQAKFWIPPLIGTWAIERKFHSAAMNMSRRLEKMSVTGIPLSKFEIK